MRIAIFRPPHARYNTAFEVQRSMYRYLAQNYDLDLTIFAEDGNNFNDDQLEVISLKRKSLSPWTKWWCSNSNSTHEHLFSYYGLPGILKDFDVIETSDPTLYYYAYNAYSAAKRYGVRLVCGSSVTIPELLWIKKGIARKVMGYASKISCCTPMALKRFEKMGALQPESEKVIILGHPFDSNIFKPLLEEIDDGLIRVLTVGRLSEEKGHQFLIKAVSRLYPHLPQLRLTIVGEGAFKDHLTSLAKDLLPDGIVKFHGGVAHKDLPGIYNHCDIFVLCSIRTDSWEEYFGAVIGEAMSCGKPVIATRIGGIPFVVKDGETGYLVGQEDVEGLTSALQKLTINEELRKEMGQNGLRHIIKNFSTDVVAQRYLQLWGIPNDSG
jgi:glycosyltransferase involved in cell wall biosynthesis